MSRDPGEIVAVLTNQHKHSIRNSVLGWLATVGPDGQPSVSPKEVFIDWEDVAILVAMIASPRSVRNIRHQPRVCFSFVDVFVQKGYQVDGEACLVTREGPQFASLHRPLAALAGPEFPIAAVLRIDVTEIRPILAPRYRLDPQTTEASQIEAAMRTYRVLPAPDFHRDVDGPAAG